MLATKVWKILFEFLGMFLIADTANQPFLCTWEIEN